jgi:P-type conjugative transfer protein TrbJ
MRFRTSLMVSTIVTLIAIASTATEAAVPVFDPFNYAQNVLTQANTLKLTFDQAQEIANQLQALEMQVRSLRAIPKGVWGEIQSDLSALRSVVEKGQSISYDDKNLSSDFSFAYPGFATTTNFADSYQRWTRNALAGIQTSLQDAGLQDRQFQSEDATLAQLQAMSDGSTGHLQALQVANMIAVQQVQQMQKLRQLQMAQIQALAGYLATQQQTQSSQYAALKAWLDGASAPAYKF